MQQGQIWLIFEHGTWNLSDFTYVWKSYGTVYINLASIIAVQESENESSMIHLSSDRFFIVREKCEKIMEKIKELLQK